MRNLRRSFIALCATLVLSGCHPSLKPLAPIKSVESACRQGAPKGPGIMSIMASIGDKPPQATSFTTKAVQAKAAKNEGLVAHWDDLALYLPNAAKTDGDAEGYVHIASAAITSVPDDSTSRPVLVLMRGAHGDAWYQFTAYDVQSPCIVGKIKS